MATYEVGPCDCCGGTPIACCNNLTNISYAFTLSTVADSSCETCEVWNGYWLLNDITAPEQWSLLGNVEGLDCQDIEPGWIVLSCGPEGYLLAFKIGSTFVATYLFVHETAEDPWNCCGENTLTLDTSNGYCTDWPSTITVAGSCPTPFMAASVHQEAVKQPAPKAKKGCNKCGKKGTTNPLKRRLR